MNYKILAFEPERGVITIQYEGMEAYAWPCPVDIDNNTYISGQMLDNWIRTQYSIYAESLNIVSINYASVSGANSIITMIDPVPFPYKSTT